jgi:cell division protease FtsH
MGGPAVVLLILLGLAFITVLFREQATAAFQISYDQFIHEVEADNVDNVEITGSTVRGTFKSAPPKERIEAPEETRLFTVEVSQYLVGDGLDTLLLKHNVRTTVKQPTDGTGVLLGIYFLIPLLLMGAFYISMRRARDPLGGSGFLGNFTKSPAKRFNAEDKQTTFADVAGLEGVKEDLKEIV